MSQIVRFNRHWLRRQQGQVRKGRRSSLISFPTLIASFGLICLIGLEFGFPAFGCNVKGNISPATGERIYHIPGQENYGETRVNWFAGERWFCSERSAMESGWRRAVR